MNKQQIINEMQSLMNFISVESDINKIDEAEQKIKALLFELQFEIKT